VAAFATNPHQKYAFLKKTRDVSTSGSFCNKSASKIRIFEKDPRRFDKWQLLQQMRYQMTHFEIGLVQNSLCYQKCKFETHKFIRHVRGCRFFEFLRFFREDSKDHYYSKTQPIYDTCHDTCRSLIGRHRFGALSA
jgi:hypothetical protein